MISNNLFAFGTLPWEGDTRVLHVDAAFSVIISISFINETSTLSNIRIVCAHTHRHRRVVQCNQTKRDIKEEISFLPFP